MKSQKLPIMVSLMCIILGFWNICVELVVPVLRAKRPRPAGRQDHRPHPREEIKKKLTFSAEFSA